MDIGTFGSFFLHGTCYLDDGPRRIYWIFTVNAVAEYKEAVFHDFEYAEAFASATALIEAPQYLQQFDPEAPECVIHGSRMYKEKEWMK